MLQIGSVLDGKYKILNQIGKGGMSVVYLALNERANKTWAVKEVRKEGVVNNAANKAALMAETNILKNLHHPNLPSIVDILDYQDSIVIVEDYVEGQDLKTVLEAEGAQPSDRVLRWGLQICDVLEYLHGQNPPIIYRDMKPANLMLKPDGDICIIDFGTAKEFKYKQNADDTMTLGTPGYAAPEQYGGMGVTDARTDIYGAGATLYHLLTGFGPKDPPYYEMKPLGELDPKWKDTGWEYILRKCCLSRKEERYQTAAELRTDLERIDDLDKRVIQHLKRRLGVFLGCVGLCVLGSLGMLGCTLAGNHAATETYGYYIDLARGESNLNTAYNSYYRAALELDPGRTEAYEALLTAIDRTETGGRLDDSAFTVAEKCLEERYGGSRPNAQYLQTRNPDFYDSLMYDLGIRRFFVHDNNLNDMEKADEYFSQITESPYLSAEQRELANILHTICANYGTLDSGNRYTNDYNYKNFWDDLCEMVSGDVSGKVGDPFFAVAVYNQMSYQLYDRYSRFADYGVTKDDMDGQLDLVEQGLRSFSENDPDLQAKVANALSTTDSARKAVAAYFDRKG